VSVPGGLIQGFPVRLPISWTVTNDGPRGSLATTWSDQIVLSRNAVLGDGDDQVVGSFARFGSLQAGESYTRGETLTLPIGVSGDYHLFVRTDAQGQVYEGGADEANNASASVAVSLLTPFSDLVVDSVTAPSDAANGRDTIQSSPGPFVIRARTRPTPRPGASASFFPPTPLSTPATWKSVASPISGTLRLVKAIASRAPSPCRKGCKAASTSSSARMPPRRSTRTVSKATTSARRRRR
jgi:hypothetical protein